MASTSIGLVFAREWFIPGRDWRIQGGTPSFGLSRKGWATGHIKPFQILEREEEGKGLERDVGKGINRRGKKLKSEGDWRKEEISLRGVGEEGNGEERRGKRGVEEEGKGEERSWRGVGEEGKGEERRGKGRWERRTNARKEGWRRSGGERKNVRQEEGEERRGRGVGKKEKARKERAGEWGKKKNMR
jgi:hypothetical protein